MHSSKARFLLPLFLSGAVLLAGCAITPKPLQGSFSAVAPEQAAQEGAIGDRVRWGGRIIAVEPSAERTCFEILSRALDRSAEPDRQLDREQGRFLACRGGFYDPAIFTDQRDLTITGRIAAFETRSIGQYEYRYPVVEADVIHLWPQRSETRVQYHDPFWPSAYYGYWGWGYPRPVRVIRSTGGKSGAESGD